MKILAFDPGGTTGVCGWHDLAGIVMQQQLDIVNHHLALWTLLEAVKPDIVVYERFDFRQGKTKIDMVAREYIGVIKLWQQQQPGVTLVPQTAAFGKGFWTNEKLKAARLYVPGSPHAMDATRHMLQYLTFKANDQTYLHMLTYGDV